MSGPLLVESRHRTFPSFLAGGGEMGARMRAFDWDSTPLGAPDNWPQSLKTIIRVMLDSRYAMWMFWGPEYTFFCNDAYLPTVGIKRDWVLGARADIVWEEIWSDVFPRIETVLTREEATWDEALLLFLERSGFTEETYHTFSYSPIYDDSDSIAGMLCVVTEVTDRVIGERRLHLLRDLAVRAAVVETVSQSCERLCAVLGSYPYDIAFAAIYTIDKNNYTVDKNAASARRAAISLSIAHDDKNFPALLPLDEQIPWPVQQLLTESSVQEIDLINTEINIRAPLWPDRIAKALLIPLTDIPLTDTAQDRLAGFAIIGISPRRLLDEGYHAFANLIANQIGSAIASVEAYEAERLRAQALTELDRAKTAFFSNVSHEFRTPLTLMLGPLETLLADSNTAPEIRGQLELAQRNSLRLLKLVNSLLDFSRIEAGRTNANYEATDLAGFTRDIASTFRSAMEAAGLQFSVHCATLPLPVYIDRDMWEKIILNLLSNAFKFTLQGSIEVRLHEHANRAVLEIEDSGVGIASEELPKLFERFHRIEKTQARTHEGSGIGLALVHELIALHGATIDVVSNVGAGSVFRIEIPFGHQHLPADKIGATSTASYAAHHARAFVEEAIRWLPDKPHGEASLKLHDTLPSDRRFANTFGARIVVADDNADMRAYMRGLLSPFYNVETAVDGVEALSMVRSHAPDLILSDVMMPRLDGFGLLAALRADTHLRDIPVVLLSARAGEDARIEGFDAGADDYLAKPFSAREMLTRVGALLELTHMRRENEMRVQLRQTQLETLLTEAPIGIFLVDSDLRIREINPVARTEFGGLENLIGSNYGEIIQRRYAPAYAAEIVGIFRHTLATGEPFYTAERSAKRHDSDTVNSYEWQIHRIPLVDGAVGVVCYFRNISAAIQARQILIEQRQALLEQQQRLQTADAQKDQFLAMLAHELRNPLAPIGNACELLSLLVEPSSKAHDAAEMIKRQMIHLTRLVDDLFDVSRITQGRVELQLENIDIAQVITQAVEAAEPLLRYKNQTLVMNSTYQLLDSTSPLSLRVEGDLTRLVQCLVNIVTNAVKYTHDGGQITLNARAENGFAVIDVADDGAGIPPELLPHVFELFVQGERTLDRALGGLGIGLSVTKGLVEMHGGTIDAFSAGAGRGSTFTIRLPLSQKIEADFHARDHIDSIPKRILLVDDNVDAADSLATLLTLVGHTTHTVNSAREALQCVEKFKPDIAILDIGLPEMDGYELARTLRTLPYLHSLKLIALTGYGQTSDRELARQAGFDRHLVKPIDFESLRLSLEKI